MKRSRNRFYRTTTSLSSAALLLAFAGVAAANPTDGVVTAGSAVINGAGTANTVINQTTDKAVIDWRGFDINAGESTRFNQPSSSSITLNRVTSSSASRINGNLSANGNLLIINQNGVVFGSNARVDVNGLVVSTADIENADFMNGSGPLLLSKAGNNPNATIINQGQITARDAGLVGLVAPNVINSGIITARLGRVQLASGDAATVDLYGDGLMEVVVSDAVTQQLVANEGIIAADGGRIALTAAAGRQIVDSLIVVRGSLKAPSITQREGKIIIGAEGSNAVKGNIAADKGKKQGASTVIVENALLDVSGRDAQTDVSGSLDASGTDTNQTGGRIEITGKNVIVENATIDASGSNGGGDIRIGGGYKGGEEIHRADTTTVDSNTTISADATDNGNGGTIVVWSDDMTDIAAKLSAKGGQYSGNGGLIETSGKTNLRMTGSVDTSAAYGSYGTWLVDPVDITITGVGGSTDTYPITLIYNRL